MCYQRERWTSRRSSLAVVKCIRETCTVSKRKHFNSMHYKQKANVSDLSADRSGPGVTFWESPSAGWPPSGSAIGRDCDREAPHALRGLESCEVLATQLLCHWDLSILPDSGAPRYCTLLSQKKLLCMSLYKKSTRSAACLRFYVSCARLQLPPLFRSQGPKRLAILYCGRSP